MRLHRKPKEVLPEPDPADPVAEVEPGVYIRVPPAGQPLENMDDLWQPPQEEER